MSFKIHIEGRAALEQALAQRADDLLRQRAARTGMRPRTLLNQVAPEVIESPEQAMKNSVVKTLLARLAEKDK
jgi:hypothetical protein